MHRLINRKHVLMPMAKHMQCITTAQCTHVHQNSRTPGTFGLNFSGHRAMMTAAQCRYMYYVRYSNVFHCWIHPLDTVCQTLPSAAATGSIVGVSNTR